MSLNQEQTRKLEKWLNSKRAFGSENCPICGYNDWKPGDIVVAPVRSGGGTRLGGPTVPMVQLICGNCAYVLLFAAVPIGIVE